MNNIAFISGSLFGMLAVIFGAFGAHYLKNIFSEELLKSFETGVKYQMYHALILLIIGYNTSVGINTTSVYFFIIGIVLFSGSIYGLCLSSSSKGHKWKFLGPITPLGGLFLIMGWGMLLYNFIY